MNGTNVNQLVDKEGRVDLARVTPEQKQKYLDALKSVNSSGAVIQVGTKIAKRIGENGTAFLTSTRAADAGEVGQVLNQMIDTLNDKVEEANIGNNPIINALVKMPIIGKIIATPVKNAVEKRVMSLDDACRKVERGLEGIVKQAISDNQTLTEMQKSVNESKVQVNEIIVALTVKLEEEKQKLANMDAATCDLTDIQNQQSLVDALEAKLMDMKSVRNVNNTTSIQIGVVIDGNTKSAQSAQSLANHGVPALKQSVSLGIAIKRQKEAIQAQNAVREKIGQVLVKNAQDIHDNVTEIAQMTSSASIALSAISTSQRLAIDTVKKLKEIKQTISAQRQKEMEELDKLDAQLQEVMTGGREVMSESTTQEAATSTSASSGVDSFNFL